MTCKTILNWRTSTLREALAQPFHCDLPTNKEEKKSPWTLSYTARANRTGIGGKATTPVTVAHASQLFSAAEPPFNRKNTMCLANPNVQIACMMYQSVPTRSASNDLQNTIEIATTLLCSTISSLIYSAQLYSASIPSLLLLCSTLLSSLSLCLSPLLSRVWLSFSCPIHSMPVYHVYIYIRMYVCVWVCVSVCVWVCVLCFKWGLKSLITRDSHLALQPLLMDSATKAAPRRELTGKSSRKSYPLQDLLAYKSRILDCNDFWLSFQTIYILFGIWETFFQVWDSSLIYTGQWFP